MRAYFFGNMYLSSIQQGIQAAHVVAEMYQRYVPGFNDDACVQFDSLYEWAQNHKTMILLNAGYSEAIRKLVDVFNSPHNPYPWATFHEGQDALDGALTCVGIILPEQIYYGAKQIRDNWEVQSEISNTGKVRWDFPEKREYTVSRWEFELMLHLNNYGLAK